MAVQPTRIAVHSRPRVAVADDADMAAVVGYRRMPGGLP
jgi:hypothetical protein